MTRASNRNGKLGAIPQSNEETVNITIQIRKNRLRPMTEVSHPVIGKTMAFDTRYDVRTHVLWSWLAPRLPAMWGNATLAILVSSTSMKAAIATTTAISHGLYRGFHPLLS